MNELMIHVEKAVRPVRASLNRRLKMREELLAHLQGIYEEERQCLEDHDAAVRAAIERFGPAHDVSRKLQTSVPWNSLAVWHFYRGFSRDRTRPASVLDATWWMLRRMFAFWVVVGMPWFGVRVWLGQLLATEAVWLWAAFMLYGFAVAWPLCAFLAAHLGILGQPKSTLRAFLFGIGRKCRISAAPSLPKTPSGWVIVHSNRDDKPASTLPNARV